MPKKRPSYPALPAIDSDEDAAVIARLILDGIERQFRPAGDADPREPLTSLPDSVWTEVLTDIFGADPHRVLFEKPTTYREGVWRPAFSLASQEYERRRTAYLAGRKEGTWRLHVR